MKIKSKTKEDTSFQERNTAITVFASVAIIPLVIVMLVGYNLSKSSIVNDENLFQKLQEKQEENDSLNEVKAIILADINTLKETFQRADSILLDFKSRSRGSEEDLAAAQGELDISRWESDWKRIRINFEDHVALVDRRLYFDKNQELRDILDDGKDWLVEISDNKDRYLLARKIAQMQGQNLGDGVVDELEQKIRDLEGENDALKDQLEDEEDRTADLEENIREGTSDADKTLQAKDEAILGLKEELTTKKEDAEQIKSEVVAKLNMIRQRLPDLDTDGFFKNREEIRRFKESLTNDLFTVEQIVRELE